MHHCWVKVNCPHGLVPQPVLDELQTELESARAQEGEDRGSIHPAGDEEIAYTETPSEIADRWIRKIERIKDAVSGEQIEVVGATANRFEGFYTAIDGGSSEELREAIGACSTEVFLEARSREVPIYAESWMIRSLARAEDVEAFGTRAVLSALEQKEVISPKVSREASIELLTLNFYFPLISTALMAHQVESNNYLINEESTFVLRVLLSPHFETWMPRAFFGCRFLLWLWSQYKWPAIIDGSRSLTASWTHELYDVLSQAEASHDLPHFVFSTVREKLSGVNSLTIVSQFEETYVYWRENIFQN